MTSDRIRTALRQAAHALGIESEPVLEFPADIEHGDFATSLALAGAKVTGMKPLDLAQKIVSALGSIEGVAKIEIAGPGFINFTLSRDHIASVIESIDDSWGKGTYAKDERTLIEYTSPNLFKPLHIGNLMANIVGESVSRLIEWGSANVKRVNYPSDIGLTVAKGVWGVLTKGYDPRNINELGLAYRDGSTAYEEDEEAKKEIDSINKRLYEGDPEVTPIREAGIETSLARIREICALLGTRFDIEIFESQAGEMGRDLVRENVGPIFKESDGAIIFPGEEYGLHTRVFVNSLGLPTYEAKDLALAKLKFDIVPFDRSITVTGAEQKEYFRVLIKAIELVFPQMAGKIVHIGNGFLSLTTGKMSSRKGNVLTGESVLEGVRERVLAIMQERHAGEDNSVIANQVAVAAIKYAVLKQRTGKNIIFDQEASLSFDGDSGPYLQYSYVRAKRVLEKAPSEGAGSAPSEATALERLIARFPAIVERAAIEYEPHYITNYLVDLASRFNSWYAAERIIGSPHEAYHLAVTRAFATTMKNGLWLIGIEAPERM